MIINLIIQERESLYKNESLVDTFLQNLKNKFIGQKIITFDTSYIKLEFLTDFVSFYKKRVRNSESKYK